MLVMLLVFIVEQRYKVWEIKIVTNLKSNESVKPYFKGIEIWNYLLSMCYTFLKLSDVFLK